jgi:hypothetical protein
MNTKQAYIKGFVKRAMSYGVDEKLFEKIAMLVPAAGLSHFKDLFRQMKDMGVRLNRGVESANAARINNPDIMAQVAKQVNPTLSKLPFIGKKLPALRAKYIEPASDKIQSQIASYTGPNFMPSRFGLNQETINVLKNDTHDPILQRILKDMRPSQVFEHELGHAIHNFEDPGLLRSGLNRLNGSPESIEFVLGRERIANNNAILNMMKNNVSPEVIENYKKTMQKGYDSYLDAAATKGLSAEYLNQIKKDFFPALQESAKRKLGLKPTEGKNTLSDVMDGFTEKLTSGDPTKFIKENASIMPPGMSSV